MGHTPAGLAGHPDQLRWNARYESGGKPSFAAHPLATFALSAPLPPDCLKASFPTKKLSKT